MLQGWRSYLLCPKADLLKLQVILSLLRVFIQTNTDESEYGCETLPETLFLLKKSANNAPDIYTEEEAFCL